MIRRSPLLRILSVSLAPALLVDTDAHATSTLYGVLTEAWTAESYQSSAQFGYSVSSAGDVNGDGYDDVIVGAYTYENASTRGKAFLYLGSVSGLDTTDAWTAESEESNSAFGTAVASAGDVNGDGYSDVLVGDPTAGTNLDGKAYLYLGSATGPEATAAWTDESSVFGAHFGTSVASAGDVNGDGYDDVAVGAADSTDPETGEGAAYVYLGSAFGLETTAAWVVESDQELAYFGGSVASAGDVNGDGYGDVLVGAYGYVTKSGGGQASLYLGSPSGLDTTAAWTAEADAKIPAGFGWSVSSAGDVNGDGYDDVVVGAPFFTDGEVYEGGAYLYLGSSGGLESSPTWSAQSDQFLAQLGLSVSAAGDVNGDGYDDVVVGVTCYDDPDVDEGMASLYLGSSAGLEASPAWTGQSDQEAAYFGTSVSSAGDVDGDGYGDVIVGASQYDDVTWTDEGKAYVYAGACGDADQDGFLRCGDDCDDDDATSYPGAPELCDGLDNSCAGSVPADELDADGDGLSACAGDCDDANAIAYPGAPELCDGFDNACAGSVPADELDVDADGVRACDGDCDDADATVYPGAPELCDGLDNGCTGFIQPDELSDSDGDGVRPCGGDCNNNDPTVYAGAPEICDDGVDNDCDGIDQDCPASPTVAAPADGCAGCNSSGNRVAPLALIGAFLVSMIRRRRLAA